MNSFVGKRQSSQEDKKFVDKRNVLLSSEDEDEDDGEDDARRIWGESSGNEGSLESCSQGRAAS